MNFLLAQGNYHDLIFTPGQDGYTSHRFMVAMDYDPIQSMCRQYFIYNNLPAAYNRFQELEAEFAGQSAQGV